MRTTLRPDTIESILSQAAGLTRLNRGASAMSGYNPSVYASRHEAALARANDVLRQNGYVPFPVQAKIVAPSLYAVTYVAPDRDFVVNETFELRLARHTNCPVPLSLVSIALDGSTEYYRDCRTVYDPLSVVAADLVVDFMAEYPNRGHFWLPRFALPSSRQV